jgi:hypothetical protein
MVRDRAASRRTQSDHLCGLRLMETPATIPNVVNLDRDLTGAWFCRSEGGIDFTERLHSPRSSIVKTSPTIRTTSWFLVHL